MQSRTLFQEIKISPAVLHPSLAQIKKMEIEKYNIQTLVAPKHN